MTHEITVYFDPGAVNFSDDVYVVCVGGKLDTSKPFSRRSCQIGSDKISLVANPLREGPNKVLAVSFEISAIGSVTSLSKVQVGPRGGPYRTHYYDATPAGFLGFKDLDVGGRG